MLLGIPPDDPRATKHCQELSSRPLGGNARTPHPTGPAGDRVMSATFAECLERARQCEWQVGGRLKQRRSLDRGELSRLKSSLLRACTITKRIGDNSRRGQLETKLDRLFAALKKATLPCSRNRRYKNPAFSYGIQLFLPFTWYCPNRANTSFSSISWGSSVDLIFDHFIGSFPARKR
jgi:hypothetical protein